VIRKLAKEPGEVGTQCLSPELLLSFPLPDIWSRAKRSEVMSKIRSVHTAPEILLRKELSARGYRYRLHLKTIPGRPDISFPFSRMAVFVNGCFWHGCSQHYIAPKTNALFWQKKLRDNKQRDRVRRRQLKRAGWTVLEFWEHDVELDPSLCAAKIEASIKRVRTRRLRPRARSPPRAGAARRSRFGQSSG